MQSQQNPIFSTISKDHFALLFPALKPLYVEDIKLRQLSMLMFEEEPLSERYSETISNGVAIFSQFLAHDVTMESTSKLSKKTALHLLENMRTINLDLDCVYGQREQSFFYDNEDKDKLLLGKKYRRGSWKWQDLQRNEQGVAIIPDARNDENLIVAGLQVAFIEFHNKMVDHLRKCGEKGDIFHKARKQVIWYYHWLTLYSYLKPMMDLAIFEQLLEEGCQYYTAPVALPLEFSGAVFRVGHSQSREIIRFNSKTEKQLFDLGTFSSIEDYIDWSYQFDFGDGKMQPARRLDTHIPKSFENIPFVNSDDEFERSLAYRNMRRGVIYGLPSGEDLARRLGFKVVEVEETKDLKLEGTPLWYYVLREAQIEGKGQHLGPVGSTILGECFLTILINENTSYLKLHPKWKPELGKKTGEFTFADFFHFINS